MRTIAALINQGKAIRGVKVDIHGRPVEVSHLDADGNVWLNDGPYGPEELTVIEEEQTFTVGVTWVMEGEYKVTAKTMDEAISIIEKGTLLPAGTYVQDTLCIQPEILMNNRCPISKITNQTKPQSK